MLMSGFAGHIDSWLATARHEKIDKLEKLNGYNFLTVAQSCEWGIADISLESVDKIINIFSDYYAPITGMCHSKDIISI